MLALQGQKFPVPVPTGGYKLYPERESSIGSSKITPEAGKFNCAAHCLECFEPLSWRYCRTGYALWWSLIWFHSNFCDPNFVSTAPVKLGILSMAIFAEGSCTAFFGR